jgi:hypothetical protein
MAISENATPESESKRWFALVIIGTLLYVSAVFAFVLGRDVEPQDPGKHIEFIAPPKAPAAAHGHEGHEGHEGHDHKEGAH